MTNLFSYFFTKTLTFSKKQMKLLEEAANDDPFVEGVVSNLVNRKKYVRLFSFLFVSSIFSFLSVSSY